MTLKTLDVMGKHWEPAHVLMASVLIQAAHDLTSREPLIREEAQQWFLSPDGKGLFSFLGICDRLELDASATREAAFSAGRVGNRKYGHVAMTFKPRSLERRHGLIRP